MLNRRRTIVLSFAAATLAAATAASAQATIDLYLPKPLPCNGWIEGCGPKQPQPNPPCDERLDDCSPKAPKPWPCETMPCDPGPFRPMGSASDSVAAITASVADGKFDAAARGLDGLYSGSIAKSGSDAGAVAGSYGSSRGAVEYKLVEPSRRFGARRTERSVPPPYGGLRRVDFPGDKDANPRSHDGEVTGVIGGAIAGTPGGLPGVVAGGIAGGIAGFVHDTERKADQDAESYRRGQEARRNDEADMRRRRKEK